MYDLIYQAARYMDEHGKCVQAYRDEYGKVCMIGALRMARLGRVDIRNEDFMEVILEGPRAPVSDLGAAEIHLNDYADHIGLPRGVPDLNDGFFATKEETVKFMMEAAEWTPGD